MARTRNPRRSPSSACVTVSSGTERVTSCARDPKRALELARRAEEALRPIFADGAPSLEEPAAPQVATPQAPAAALPVADVPAPVAVVSVAAEPPSAVPVAPGATPAEPAIPEAKAQVALPVGLS